MRLVRQNRPATGLVLMTGHADVPELQDAAGREEVLPLGLPCPAVSINEAWAIVRSKARENRIQASVAAVPARGRLATYRAGERSYSDAACFLPRLRPFFAAVLVPRPSVFAMVERRSLYSGAVRG
jgi:hypothetical protein